MKNDLHITRGWYLPKWTQDGAIYHVCIRLHDSYPQASLRDVEEQREHLRRRSTQSPIPLTEDEQELFEGLFSDRTEQLLNRGMGACFLEKTEIAELIRDTLHFYESSEYRLHGWCVMPNHVHVIVEPFDSAVLSKVVRRWKSYSGKKANELLNRKGPFWSRDYYSRIIQDEKEYRAQLQYVWNNPEHINQHDWPWCWLKED